MPDELNVGSERRHLTISAQLLMSLVGLIVSTAVTIATITSTVNHNAQIQQIMLDEQQRQLESVVKAQNMQDLKIQRIEKALIAKGLMMPD